MSLKKIAELEASLEKLLHDNMHLKEAGDAVHGVTQARLHKVSDELVSLQSLHRECGRQVGTQYQSIVPFVSLTILLARRA